MRRNLLISALIVILAGLAYIPFIGNLNLFDWDEINFAESAREMLLTHDYLTVQIFFEPFWEKPPLFIWFQVVSMKLFGINEFAARFPNAVAGIFTLVVLFWYGKKLVNERFGIIWTIAYGVSLLPFFYFKTGIIDPWFNLFIFLGISHYYFAQQEQIDRKKYLQIILSAFYIGLAVLTKGPVAVLVFGLVACILLVVKRFHLFLKAGHVGSFILVLTITGGFWFLLQIFNGNSHTIVDFFEYQIRLFKTKDAGHGGFPLYHFVVLFFGVFPASVLAIRGHKSFVGYSEKLEYFRKCMIALLWVVLILFSLVQTKIIHYSSLSYFSMTFLASYTVYATIENRSKVSRWIILLIAFQASLISIIVIGLPILEKTKHWLISSGKVTQAFTVGQLQAETGWNLWIVLIGIVLLSGTIVALILLKKEKYKVGFSVLAISAVLFIYSSIIFLSPGIENMVQNSAISFLKSIKGKDVYVQTIYKSYAMLFYTEARPQSSKEAYDLGWLLYGGIDKDAYFVLRADKKDEYLTRYVELQIVYEKNGYVFCKRLAVTNNK